LLPTCVGVIDSSPAAPVRDKVNARLKKTRLELC
jgi:hypothetical protein